MDIEYSKRAAKAVNGMDRISRQRIKAAVEAIPKGDIKPLRGSDGYFRLRIGGWRIIFSYKGGEAILVHKIAPRGEVYKGA